MLSRCSSRGSIPYEPLLEAREVETLNSERTRLRLVCLAAALLLFGNVLLGLTGSQSDSLDRISTFGGANDHTIPTPLSIVDPDTGRYLYSLHNPIYETLKSATFAERGSLRRLNVLEHPELELDRTHTTVRQPLTLTWTRGRTHDDQPLVQDDDVVALYCPHDHDIFHEAATIAQVRATSERHGGTSNQSWYIPDFPVTRQETCQFRLYQAQSLALLAESPILTIQDSPRTPTSIHLAFSTDPSELVVQFTTGEAGTPVAMYGIDATTLKVEGVSHTYGANDMCQAPANLTEPGKFQSPGMLHKIILSDLQLDTDYQYKVGLASGQGIVWSETYIFHSAPPIGNNQPFSYVVYGDQGCPSLGWGDGGLWTSAMAVRELDRDELPIRAVHHFGDLSYARGAAHIWDEWFHMISSFASRVPLMIGVGNHEYDHTAGGEGGKDPSGVETPYGFMPLWGNFGEDSGGECGVPTAQRFVMPSSSGSNGVFWYSYDYANVHTTVISSEHNMTKGSPQYSWLEADLERVDRNITPWLVLESHRPLYESEAFWDQSAVGVAMRYEIEELLLIYNVDLVLAGHYHMYMRTCDGLYQSKCHGKGPTHITVGSAGAELDNGVMNPRSWTAHVIQNEWGYGRITVMNESAMHWEFIKAGADNDTDAGTVRDHVWIIRDR